MNRQCECGCGQTVTGQTRAGARRFVTGHNLRVMVKTEEHKQRIGQGIRRAWETTRPRLPIGTTRVNHQGYVVVKVVRGAGHWRLQHALVMEAAIGRALRPGECVHHINGLRDDNRIENLYLCRDRAEHNAVERSLAETFRALMDGGLARFNPGTGRYEGVLQP